MAISERQYHKLEEEILATLRLSGWDAVPYFDDSVTVKSRQTLNNFNADKYFFKNQQRFLQAQRKLDQKARIAEILGRFLAGNEYESRLQYRRVKKEIESLRLNARAYRVEVKYISSAGNHLASKELCLDQRSMAKFTQDPSLLVGKGEYNRQLKEQQQAALDKKQRQYYEKVNNIIAYADTYKNYLFVKGSQEQLENEISQLYDKNKPAGNIMRIKTENSQEWTILDNFLISVENNVKQIVDINHRLYDYYNSPEFLQIQKTCEALMSSQREFNQYIEEKVQSISKLFGTRVVRNETIHDSEYNYIRPFEKTITPFTANVSKTVFASAENAPLEYVVKYFYPDKQMYPAQIQKLYQLVEELETLQDAKRIIDSYKSEYQQYIGSVPPYVMQLDADGFYSRLGFAVIDESVLHVEYKFCATTPGGLKQDSFTVPMTEDNIVALIHLLENKLTAAAAAKAQRRLMTRKLREYIKTRDNYTCRMCGNSTYVEPNLLLEIDHIVPVSKGGKTEENNLQTLCWKCNRTKSNKLLSELDQAQ